MIAIKEYALKDDDEIAGRMALSKVEDLADTINGNLKRIWQAIEKQGVKIDDSAKQNAEEHLGLVADALNTATDRLSKKEAYTQSAQWSIIVGLVVGILMTYLKGA